MNTENLEQETPASHIDTTGHKSVESAANQTMRKDTHGMDLKQSLNREFFYVHYGYIDSIEWNKWTEGTLGQ